MFKFQVYNFNRKPRQKNNKNDKNLRELIFIYFLFFGERECGEDHSHNHHLHN